MLAYGRNGSGFMVQARGKTIMGISAEDNFVKYHEALYQDSQGWRDYELTSAGYEEWYYDCLPTDKKARILDIGSGDGKFLFFLQQNGYSALEGLELSALQAQEAGKHVKCPIHVIGDTSAFLLEHPSYYQMITMNDVLEHVSKRETVRLLEAVLSALQPGGNAVINVPQASGLFSTFCRYNDFTHETLFTEMSLKQVLLMAGFSDIRFISQKWSLKLTPRHLAYRFVRLLWYGILKLIYTIEAPGERHPSSFQVRLVASCRSTLSSK
jgi:cyclopropane fatty-acyl-phospholipid synthase-like methyltransferase